MDDVAHLGRLVDRDLNQEWFGRAGGPLQASKRRWSLREPRTMRGACLWFTGLSGSGKTTTADRVIQLLEERGRVVTVLDGDVVRTHLSRGLGFSREDRDENVRRVGFVAGEVVRHGGLVICALVSPIARRATRSVPRSRRSADRVVHRGLRRHATGRCGRARREGLYAATERGEVQAMTGVSDPYEPPFSPGDSTRDYRSNGRRERSGRAEPARATVAARLRRRERAAEGSLLDCARSATLRS